MSHKSVSELEGFIAAGGNMPVIDPALLRIVGIDLPETPENWFAHCARVHDIPDAEILVYAESMVAAGKVDHIVKAYRDGKSLVVLDGRTTTRAARKARELQADRKVKVDERVTIRVNILKGEEEELYRINLDSHKHRPLTMTQLCRGFLTYYNKVNEDIAKTAAFFKVDKATVKARLAHFDLSPKLQRMIDDKELPASATKKLAKLPRDKQIEAASEIKKKKLNKGAKLAAALDQAAAGEKIEGKEKIRSLGKARCTEIASRLANGQANHLKGPLLEIARAIAAWERYKTGDKEALDYLLPIKEIIEAKVEKPAKVKAEKPTAPTTVASN